MRVSVSGLFPSLSPAPAGPPGAAKGGVSSFSKAQEDFMVRTRHVCLLLPALTGVRVFSCRVDRAQRCRDGRAGVSQGPCSRLPWTLTQTWC